MVCSPKRLGLAALVLTVATTSGVLSFPSNAAACSRFNPFCSNPIRELDPTSGDISITNNTGRWINVTVSRSKLSRRGGFEHSYLIKPSERNVLVEHNIATTEYLISGVEVNSRNQRVPNGLFWNAQAVDLTSNGLTFTFR